MACTNFNHPNYYLPKWTTVFANAYLIMLVLLSKRMAVGQPGGSKQSINGCSLCQISPCRITLSNEIVIATDRIPRYGLIRIQIDQFMCNAKQFYKKKETKMSELRNITNAYRLMQSYYCFLSIPLSHQCIPLGLRYDTDRFSIFCKQISKTIA